MMFVRDGLNIVQVIGLNLDEKYLSLLPPNCILVCHPKDLSVLNNVRLEPLKFYEGVVVFRAISAMLT